MGTSKYPPEFCTRIGRKVLRLYQTWADMHRRCKPGERSDQKNYHGRGIRVCRAWADWPTFARWARSHGYDDSLTIDRIRDDLGYNPRNCRFITRAANIARRDVARVSASSRKARLKANARPFRCIETGEVFLNQQKAALVKGVCLSGICMALSGKLKKTGGLHWEYLGQTIKTEAPQEIAV